MRVTKSYPSASHMLKHTPNTLAHPDNGRVPSTSPPDFAVAFAAIMTAVENTAREVATAQWSQLQFENASSTSDEPLTVEKTALLLDVVPQTVLEWRKRGFLVGYKIGHRVYFKRSEVLAALKVQSMPDGRRKYARRQYEKKAR